MGTPMWKSMHNNMDPYEDPIKDEMTAEYRENLRTSAVMT